MWGEGAVSIANNVGPLPNALSFASVVAVRVRLLSVAMGDFRRSLPLLLDLQKVHRSF
jgi:hypothetical protein